MTTPQVPPDAEAGGDSGNDQQHEAVVSSFLSGGLSGGPSTSPTKTNTSCAELPARAAAAVDINTTVKKAPAHLNDLHKKYLECQESARKNRLNLWRYGDITEDDDTEFGMRSEKK